MIVFHAAATWLLVVSGGVAVAASLYLVTLAVAALFARPIQSHGLDRSNRASAPNPFSNSNPSETVASRLVVIVPAHNEVELLGRCIDSLQAQTYPANRYRIVVVADNCTDATADLARTGGVEVLVRDAPTARGKGQALRWAMDRLLAEPHPADAFVVVDADSVADPDLLAALEARMVAGAEVVQAEYLVLDEPGTGAELRQAAFLLFHRTRFSGRAALGMACNLVGNGMLFTHSVLQRVPWSAFSATEDLEYSIDLRLAGIKPRYAAAARISGPAPGRGRAADTQRMRWEGGRFHLVRTRLVGLVATALRRRDWSLLDVAADLAVPPLGLLVITTLGGLALATAGWFVGVTAGGTLLIWTAAALGITGYVAIGLCAARAPASTYRALLSAPRFLLAKTGSYLRMTRGLHADQWERTERPSEAGPNRKIAARPVETRVYVCGVPIDVVDQATAADRVMIAVAQHPLDGRIDQLADQPFVQVTTVNLQFLVTARHRPQVRRVLCAAELSVADGAPVVWLARLLGHRLPGRVAGADLVPTVMDRAAQQGTRVFLLGGTGGSAAAAAVALTARYPGLQISGVCEPPMAALSDLPDEAILEQISEAGAEILLVGFGHPKQELWIAALRDRLPVAVAIGVGCTFDIIAGRRSRAPRWVRRIGFEWLYRVAHEPRRLLPRYLSCAFWLGVLVPLAAWGRLHNALATLSKPSL